MAGFLWLDFSSLFPFVKGRSGAGGALLVLWDLSKRLDPELTADSLG